MYDFADVVKGPSRAMMPKASRPSVQRGGPFARGAPWVWAVGPHKAKPCVLSPDRGALLEGNLLPGRWAPPTDQVVPS